MTEVHIYSAGEAGLLVNAYLVETDRGVVAIDGTLTESDSRALRSRIDSLGKPLLGVLVTHAHPDHVAGIANLLDDSGASVVALESVRDLMRATEEAKHAQWGPVFGDEWIPRWVYPDRLVENGEAVTFDGITFRVYEVGPGGDCDANSVWVLEDEPAAAFVGDLVFNGTHSYIADGRVLRWLANIERFRALLEEVATLYPGHGHAGGVELLDVQKDYLLAYCAAVLEVAGNSAMTDERAKVELAGRMRRVLPGAPLELMLGLSADAVAAELNGKDANQ